MATKAEEVSFEPPTESKADAEETNKVEPKTSTAMLGPQLLDAPSSVEAPVQ